MPRRKKKKLTERLSAWKEEQKTEKQPSQQDDKQAEVESVQEVESGVQEPAEMLMEVETGLCHGTKKGFLNLEGKATQKFPQCQSMASQSVRTVMAWKGQPEMVWKMMKWTTFFNR
ncbi:uncharacterized protein LOC144925915 isoform X2 [Branchiostoma floridae x Branchiostoma belcheri]